MLIEPVDDDPIRTFNDIEKTRQTRNLNELIQAVRNVDSKTREFSIDLIRSWHVQLFDGVRDHAGRFRSHDYGEDVLNFGPHRSVHRANVSAELEQHKNLSRSLISQLDDLQNNMEPSKFVGDVIKTALYLHAEFIKIHPFRDGNGRIGRLIITFILSRFNIPPLVFEVPKQEYIDCLNHYYLNNSDLDPLYKLSLRIYNNQI